MSVLNRLFEMSGGDKPTVWSARTKKPVAAPVKKYAWDTNYATPSDATRTATIAPQAPMTTADYAGYQRYWDKYGRIHKDYSGNFDHGKNLRTEYDMRVNAQNQAALDIGRFGLSVLSDPIALGASLFDFAKDPSWQNALGLGVDAVTPGNISPFLKGASDVALAGAAARELTKKGIGRIVTNLVPPAGYEGKIRGLMDMYRQKGFQPLAKSVIDDIPAYEITIPDREFPYRKMYGLEPRDVKVYSQYRQKSYSDYEDVYGPQPEKHYAVDGQGSFGDDFTYEGVYPNPIMNSDGTYTLDKNSLAFKEASDMYFPSIDYTKEQTIGSIYNQLFGGYSVNWDPRKGEALAVDDWDFNLHPGEFKMGWEAAKNNYDYAKELRNYAKARNVDMGAPILKSLIESGELFSTTALRYAMSKITDPVKYRVPLDIVNNSDLNDHINHSFLRKFGRASEWNAPDIIRKDDDDLPF